MADAKIWINRKFSYEFVFEYYITVFSYLDHMLELVTNYVMPAYFIIYITGTKGSLVYTMHMIHMSSKLGWICLDMG